MIKMIKINIVIGLRDKFEESTYIRIDEEEEENIRKRGR